jgi:serine/threonine protein kinase
MLPAGTRLDDTLVIAGFIASSGFGCVFRARDLRTDEAVAVKCLKPEFQAKAFRRRRFAQEAQVWSALADHPAVVRFIRVITHGRLQYLVIEYCDGGSLLDLLEGEYAHGLPPDLACRTFASICRGLDHIHRSGFTFRDVNLGNVMYCREGERLEAKLTDFGLACPAGDEGERLGAANVNTPGQEQCTAPDQWRGSTATPVDVYALGVVGWALLTGAILFEAPEKLRDPVSEGGWYAYREALMKLHLKQKPRDPRELRSDVPAPVARIIMSCLEKEARKRPRDLLQLADDWEKACADWQG